MVERAVLAPLIEPYVEESPLTSSLHRAYLSLVLIPVPLIVTLALTGPEVQGGVRPTGPSRSN